MLRVGVRLAARAQCCTVVLPRLARSGLDLSKPAPPPSSPLTAHHPLTHNNRLPPPPLPSTVALKEVMLPNAEDEKKLLAAEREAIENAGKEATVSARAALARVRMRNRALLPRGCRGTVTEESCRIRDNRTVAAVPASAPAHMPSALTSPSSLPRVRVEAPGLHAPAVYLPLSLDLRRPMVDARSGRR